MQATIGNASTFHTLKTRTRRKGREVAIVAWLAGAGISGGAGVAKLQQKYCNFHIFLISQQIYIYNL
jgi:hypothetical protein